jgi:selenocysteine lyase/cysteine desulfurase
VYLNHAAISPPSLPVREACMRVLDDYAREGAGAWMRYREQREELKADLAGLVGARPEDLGLVPSTTQGVIDVALCLPWKAGDCVVVFEGEFPTNVTPWQAAAERFDLEVAYGRVRDFAASVDQGLSRLEEQLQRGVRLVAVSAVQFQTGLAMPLREMAELCHRHGAELFVDAIQAVGGVPLDVGELGVDYLACGSHKWLMGLEGAGFVYVSPQRIDGLRPVVAGWMSHEDCAAFLFEGEGHLRYDRPIRRRADFLEVGAMPTIGFAALGASVALLRQLGVPAVFEHVSSILDDLEAGLAELGFESLRASSPAQRSGILGVRPPAAGPDLGALWKGLGERGIACSTPDGVLRFAPQWPNDRGQVPHVLEAVREVLEVAS